MSSPYLIRTRNSPPTPETKSQLFKVFQFSPVTSGKDILSCSRNHQINSNKSISRSISALRIRKNQVQIKPIIMSQQQLAHNQSNSSPINQSQRIREKNVLPQLIFQKPENNALSMSLENNNILVGTQSKVPDRKSSQALQYNEKKSYRNHLHLQVLGVPYRKCHSSMEQKIVNIINKIKNGKQCNRQIETLIERSRKVSAKELSNRYFISGLYVIHRLINKSKDADVLASKIQDVIQEIRARVFQELDSIRGFEISLKPVQNPQFNKDVLIRKAFQVFRRKRQEAKKQILQKQAINLSSWFLEQQPINLNLFWNQLRKQ